MRHGWVPQEGEYQGNQKAKEMSESANKNPSAATLRYALQAAKATLGDGDAGVTTKEDGGVLHFALKDQPYATLAISGSEMVVTLRQAKALEGAAELRFYQPAATPGWLELRTPITRDPRRWLEARVGSFVGKAMFEIENGSKP
jgi:hypothetical protein